MWQIISKEVGSSIHNDYIMIKDIEIILYPTVKTFQIG